MKRLLVVVLTLGLLFAVSASAFAAVHHENWDKALFNLNNPPITDTWYTTLFYPPHLTVAYDSVSDYMGVPGLDYSALGVDFFLMDQMFAGYRSAGAGSSDSAISGSYLFDFGLFLGYESNDIVGYSNISAGYRYKFGQFNYVAVSVDNMDYDALTDTLMNFDIDAFYVTDQIKVKGEILIPDGDDTQLYLDGAYKVSDTLCVGATLYVNGTYDETTLVGATYTGVNKLVLDCQFGSLIGNNAYAVSGMYGITNQIKVGLQNMKIGDDDSYSYLKAKYDMNEKQKVVFQYKLNDPVEMILCYEQLFY